MNNIMKLAEAMAVAMAGDKDAVALIEARAALEAAVTAQEKQIEQLTKQYESLRIAYGLMHGSSK